MANKPVASPLDDPVQRLARVSRIFRRILILIGCLLLAGLVVLERPFYHIRQLQQQYDQVQPGMSEAEVKQIMGEPFGDCGLKTAPAEARWDDQGLAASEQARVRKAIHYHVNTFFLPVCFEITFDDQDKVVGRHRYD